MIDVGALARIAPDGSKREAAEGWDAADALAEWSDVTTLRRAAFEHAKPVDRAGLLAAVSTDASSISVSLVCGDAIKPEPVSWVWPGWLARGKCHILGGAPGCGKTTIALSLAATITRGGAWPDGTQAPVGNVIVWSGEDDSADTLAPRLIAAGANMTRVLFVGDVFEAGKARSFDPARDIEPLRAAIEQAGGAALLVVDPIVSAVAGDSHKNAETRRALQPLVDLAGSVGAVLIGITHFSKGTAGREPTERLTGSLAFGALARVVMVAAKQQQTDAEAEPPPRIFVRAKSNIGTDDGGFFYELAQGELRNHPGIVASSVQWGAAIEGAARDILADAEGTGSQEDGEALGTAKRFLEEFLSAGPVAMRTIEVAAKDSGIAWATVRRAKTAIGVQVTRDGFGPGGRSTWALPHRCSNTPIDAQQKKVSTYGEHEHLCAETVEVEL
jgi:putative DNA primase/helicase